MGETQLPPHWKVVKLSEVCQFTSKPRGLKYSDYEKIPFIPMELIPIGSLYFDNFTWQDGLKITSGTYFENGDFLIAKITPSFENGKQGIIEYLPLAFGVATTEVIPIKEKSGLSDKEFLAYYLLRQDIRNELAQKMEGSTGRQRLSKSVLENVDVYIPPLPEQKTIAHTLRTIQKAKETRQRELELERERKAALMQYLFTHGTGNEPRKQTEIGKIPENWEVVTLDKVCEFLQYGTSKLCDSDSSGIPVLRIPNVIGGKINIFDLKFTKPEKKEFEKLSLSDGDLLFVRTNGRKEYIGRCAVYCGKPPHAMFASYLIRVRLKLNTLLPEFFQFYTMTHRGKSYLSGRASNAADGKFNINTQTIKAVLVPIPPLDEQHEIIGTLQACDRKIQALEKEITLIDELFHAMLEQLMTGKISTQPLTENYV